MNDNQPIRVAHIVGKMVGGGVESFIMNYYRNVDKTKIQFDFFIDEDSTVIPREEIEFLGGRIYTVPPYQKIFSYIKSIKKILKDNNYKIVHSHLNSLSVFPLFGAYLAKIPIRIAHSHSTTNRKEWKKNIVKNILKPFSKVFATHYLACSNHAANWLFGDENVPIIHNAIDMEKFKFSQEKRLEIRKQLNLENKLVIGHVGRFVLQKNHDFLIKIFESIHNENENSILLLVGDGPLENAIRKKITEKGLNDCVIFLGVRDDVNEIMQAMDYFVFPSLYEGLGIVLIEAQCIGLKVICSTEVPEEVDITGMVEFVSLKENAYVWKEKIINFNKKNDEEFCNKKELYEINAETLNYQNYIIKLYQGEKKK